jgi:hypothetical protein
LVIFGDGAAPAKPVPGLLPAVVLADVGDELTCWELATLSCLLHIEKFKAKIKGRIANRIIIKEVHALSAAAQKTSAFYMQSPKNGWLTGEKPLVKDRFFAIESECCA